MNRYPRRGSVSTKRGLSAESPEDLPDLVDSGVEVALDIDKRVRPETLLQLLPRDHLARALQQDGEHLERLPAELQLHAILAQLARLHVCFKCAEAYKPRRMGSLFQNIFPQAKYATSLVKVIDEHDVAVCFVILGIKDPAAIGGN